MGLFNLALFFLMCGMAFGSEGFLPRMIRSAFYGLFGVGAFRIAIFCPLFLAASFLPKREKNIKFKSRCVIAFILCFGMIHHLLINDATLAVDGLSKIFAFYQQGIMGGSGGVICGGLAYILRWFLGNALALIFLIVLWLLALLGAVEITLPGIIEAIRNLPKNNPPSNGGGAAAQPYNPSARVVQAVDSFLKKNKEKREQKRQWKMENNDDAYDDYDDEEEELDYEEDNPLNRFFFGRKK